MLSCIYGLTSFLFGVNPFLFFTCIDNSQLGLFYSDCQASEHCSGDFRLVSLCNLIWSKGRFEFFPAWAPRFVRVFFCRSSSTTPPQRTTILSIGPITVFWLFRNHGTIRRSKFARYPSRVLAKPNRVIRRVHGYQERLGRRDRRIQ